jgi:antitoxin component YwqK of YwqJK toxin-antitoxin module
LWLRYDENGVKIGQGSYANGKKDGTWLVWDPSGIKRFEMQYKEGEKVDTWYEFDSTGSLVSERTFNMASK